MLIGDWIGILFLLLSLASVCRPPADANCLRDILDSKHISISPSSMTTSSVQALSTWFPFAGNAIIIVHAELVNTTPLVQSTMQALVSCLQKSYYLFRNVRSNEIETISNESFFRFFFFGKKEKKFVHVQYWETYWIVFSLKLWKSRTNLDRNLPHTVNNDRTCIVEYLHAQMNKWQSTLCPPLWFVLRLFHYYATSYWSF